MKTTKIITALLAALGFTGCNFIDGSNAPMYGPPDMYGSPYAEFELRGNVVDESGTPIEGISVSFRWNEVFPEEYIPRGRTAETGVYDIGYTLPKGDWTIVATARDVDGPENGGEFETDIKTIEVLESDYVKDPNDDNSWFQGKATKTVDFTLVPKNSEPEQPE